MPPRSVPFALARWVDRTAWLVFARHVSAVYVGVGAIALVVFGRGGVTASELTGAFDHTPTERAFALIAWAALFLPAARGIVRQTPAYVRALPVHGAWGCAFFGGCHLLMNAGWGWLWGRAGGWGAGVCAALVAAALHACFAVPRVDWRAVVGAAGILAMWAAPHRGPCSTLVAACVLCVAEMRAWRRLADRPHAQSRPWVAGAAPLALARAHLAYVWRAESGAVGRAGLGLVATGCLSGLVARNSSPTSFREAAWLALATSLFPTILCVHRLTVGVLRSEHVLEACMRVTGASPAVRTGGHVLAVATLGAMAGAVVSVTALPCVASLQAAMPQWLAVSVAWGLGCACAACAVARAASGRKSGSAARPAVVALLGGALVIVVGARSIALGAILHLACAAAALIFTRRTAPPLSSVHLV